MEFSTPPLQMTHLMPINGTILNAGGGTLRRGMRAMVPPPDVTHHTNTITTTAANANNTNHSKSAHDLNNSINQNVSQQTLNNHSNKSSQLSSNNSSMTTSTKQPPGILKDPNRKCANILPFYILLNQFDANFSKLLFSSLSK